MKSIKQILEANKARKVEKPEDDNQSGKEGKVPAGGKTLTGQKYNEIDTTPTIPPLTEEEKKGKHIVATFGRMNPPTTGHEKLVDHVKKIADKHGAEAHVYLSHSQDKKKNPLSYEKKHALAHEAFGDVVKHTPKEHAHMLGIAKHLDGKADHLHFVVGSDRVEEAKKKLHAYNGKDYHFKSIHVHSAGDRDPDADDTSGMSASKMRAHAHAGEHEEFKKGLPKKLQHKSHEIMKHVRGDVHENLEESLNAQQRQKRAMQFRRIKNRVELGRARALRRRAGRGALTKRARRLAIKNMRSRILHGQKYGDLSYSARAQIDNRLKKRKKSIGRIAQRLLPKVQRAEAMRKIGGRFQGVQKSGAQHVSEETLLNMVNAVMEDMDYQLTEREIGNLYEKAEQNDLPYEVLESVFRRGLHDWTLNEDTTLSFQEYAFNRVNSFCAEGAAFDMDFDLLEDYYIAEAAIVATPDGVKNTPADGHLDNAEDDAAQTAVARMNSNPTPHRTDARPGNLKKIQIVKKIINEMSEKKPEQTPGEKNKDKLSKILDAKEKAFKSRESVRAKEAVSQIQSLRSCKPESLTNGIQDQLDHLEKLNAYVDGSGKAPKLEEEALAGEKRRIDMPQLTNFDAFKKDLEDNGHKMTDRTRKPGDLDPSQKHFNQEKVDKLIKNGWHKDKPIITSADDHVIDGHHRWKACEQDGCDVKTRQVSLKADELLDFLKGKPYVQKKGLHEEAASVEAASEQAFADLFLAYFKAHSAHWNVTGENFSEAHEFFKSIYEDLWDGIDEIAEQQRQINKTAAINMPAVVSKSNVDGTLKGKSFVQMAKDVYDANEVSLASLKAVYDAAEKAGMVGVSNVIQNRISNQQKHAWMLRSTVQKG